MHVAVVQVDLHVPLSRSLKEKRAAVRPVVEGLRHRFALSVAEVGFLEKWQRALIGFAVVSGSHAHAQDVVGSAERWLWSRPDVEVAGFTVRWIDDDGEMGDA